MRTGSTKAVVTMFEELIVEGSAGQGWSDWGLERSVLCLPTCEAGRSSTPWRPRLSSCSKAGRLRYSKGLIKCSQFRGMEWRRRTSERAGATQRHDEECAIGSSLSEIFYSRLSQKSSTSRRIELLEEGRPGNYGVQALRSAENKWCLPMERLFRRADNIACYIYL